MELRRQYPGREIDLQMENKQAEQYKAPPAKPFSGKGQMLGAVVPKVITSAQAESKLPSLIN